MVFGKTAVENTDYTLCPVGRLRGILKLSPAFAKSHFAQRGKLRPVVVSLVPFHFRGRVFQEIQIKLCGVFLYLQAAVRILAVDLRPPHIVYFSAPHCAVIFVSLFERLRFVNGEISAVVKIAQP